MSNSDVKYIFLYSLIVAMAMVGMAGCSTRGRYLFVVPEQLPSGESSAAQQARLETWLAETAGGYTRLGDVQGGWKAPDGAIITERNLLYLVSIPKGARPFRRQLEQLILKEFEQQEAWIEGW